MLAPSRGELSFQEAKSIGRGSMSFVRSRGIVGTALLALVFLAIAPTLSAQTTSAYVSGSVNDAQGGALPGATVTITSKSQGNTLSTTTDAQGRFVFPIVRPDNYTLKVT